MEHKKITIATTDRFSYCRACGFIFKQNIVRGGCPKCRVSDFSFIDFFPGEKTMLDCKHRLDAKYNKNYPQ